MEYRGFNYFRNKVSGNIFWNINNDTSSKVNFDPYDVLINWIDFKTEQDFKDFIDKKIAKNREEKIDKILK